MNRTDGSKQPVWLWGSAVASPFAQTGRWKDLSTKYSHKSGDLRVPPLASRAGEGGRDHLCWLIWHPSPDKYRGEGLPGSQARLPPASRRHVQHHGGGGVRVPAGRAPWRASLLPPGPVQRQARLPLLQRRREEDRLRHGARGRGQEGLWQEAHVPAAQGSFRSRRVCDIRFHGNSNVFHSLSVQQVDFFFFRLFHLRVFVCSRIMCDALDDTGTHAPHARRSF